MKIRLTKHAQIGQQVFFKGWEGEVTDEQGASVIGANRGVEVGGDSVAKKKVAKKKVAAQKSSKTGGGEVD